MWSTIRRNTTLWRVAIVLGLAGAAAVALREVVLSSTFQLFGDYVARVDTPERVVALTFDDGPNPYWTPKFLSALDERRVRATFFMMGRNVERYPAVAREVLRHGHEIGNHSYSHPKLILMSPGRVRGRSSARTRCFVALASPARFIFARRTPRSSWSCLTS